MTIPYGHRFEAIQALRQTLQRAVSRGMLNSNPAKQGVENRQRPRVEHRPFDSWEQIRALADRTAAPCRPLVLFAAATGPRPSERIALEHRDIDRQARIVYVRRTYRNGRLKCPKKLTAPPPCGAAAGERARSTRPPTARPPVTTRLPGAGRRYLDLHNLRNRNWKPAQRALGIDPIRRVSDLGHTFATFALRAGISTFDRSRYMSASLTIIDRHYGHPTKDGRDHAIALLDAQNIHDVHAVEARWTRRKGSSTPGCPGTTA